MTGGIPRGRLNLVATLCLVPFVLLVPRLAWLQLVEKGKFDEVAQRQRYVHRWLPPLRGDIVDRHGRRLAFSVPDTARAGGMRRIYPYAERASQLLGDLNHEGQGADGLERAYEEELRGHPGYTVMTRDGDQNQFYSVPGSGRPPVPGYQLELSIDANLQDIAASRLRQQVERMGARRGVAVAVDPRTGDVLAMAGWPAFDPAGGGPHASQRTLRAVTDPYEPGSTAKIIPTLAALDDDLFRPESVIHCENGRFTMDGRTFTDHHAYGSLTLRDCFAVSSNIAFAKVGKTCGERLYDTARRLGFGSATGVGLPESAGRLRDPEDWTRESAPSIAIGYEIMVTPLQLAMAYAAVANEGVLMRPRLLRSLVDRDGEVVFHAEPEAVGRVTDAKTANTVLAFMRRVVSDGTGKEAALSWTSVGGKTGTSEQYRDGAYSSRHHYATFVGVAPLEDPRIVLLVMIDDPARDPVGGFGGSAAAPVFHEILEAYARVDDALLKPVLAEVAVQRRGGGRSLIPEVGATVPESSDGAYTPADGVPDVRTLSKRQALRVLRQRGYDARLRGTGQVVSQDPEPGTRNARVITLVCREPEPVGPTERR